MSRRQRVLEVRDGDGGPSYSTIVLLNASTAEADARTLEVDLAGGGGGAPSGPAGGDLGGTYPNPTVTDLTITSEARGDLLTRGASAWVRLPPGTSGYALLSAGAGADLTWGSVYAPGGTDVAVADGGTGASTASGARTNLGLVIGTDVQAPNVGIVIAPTAIAPGTDYEIDTDGYVVRKTAAGFANAMTGWTTQTTGSSSFSASGGTLTIVHDGSTGDQYYAGTSTAPHARRTIGTSLQGSILTFTYHLAMTAANANFDTLRGVLGSALGRISIGFYLEYTGSNFNFKWLYDESAGTVLSGLSLGTVTTGYWCRVQVDEWGRFILHYAAGSSSSEPASTGWTYVGRGTSAQLAGAVTSAWMWAFAQIRVSGSGSTGKVTTGTERITPGVLGLTDYAPFGGQGYTASTTLTTHVDAYIGTVSDSTLNAAVQAAITLALNRRPGETATWEVAVTRGSVGSYGTDTWTASGSVSCTGSGAYVRIRLRATGTTTTGSVWLAALTVGVA